ncbi:PaaI family thioesterase [Hyphomonas sp.]|uniref:PaaI family thioesterase n=1 Tax=Hyphomonas sp. TaxID=87 RepID=UPI001BCCE0E3|nr:PaaI family thioesterase [Hyphomonas sp.]
MTEPAIPEGYSPHFRKSPFTDPWEPLFSRTQAREVSIGLVLSQAHCNSRGLVHGGLIASLADNAMGLSCMAALQEEGRGAPGGLVTITLGTDYLGPARIGQWLATDTHFVKTGGSICFADCLLRADGVPVARAGATFKVLQAG